MKARLAAARKKGDGKKKGSSAAIAEARQRAAKAAKSKDSRHFNQAPTR